MTNQQLYTTADKQLELYTILTDFLHDKTEHILNRNFFLTPDEYEDLIEHLGNKIVIITPETDLTSLPTEEQQYLLVTKIPNNLGFSVQMSVFTYLNYIYYIDNTFFKTEEEVEVYTDLLTGKQSIEIGALTTFIYNFLNSTLTDTCIGVLNFGEANNRTFFDEGSTYPLLSNDLIPILYIAISEKFKLFNNIKQDYEQVQPHLITNLSRFAEAYLQLNDDQTVGYVTLKRT